MGTCFGCFLKKEESLFVESCEDPKQEENKVLMYLSSGNHAIYQYHSSILFSPEYAIGKRVKTLGDGKISVVGKELKQHLVEKITYNTM